MIDKEHKYCIGKDDHSWEVGYDKGYEKGRADAIDEFKQKARNKLLMLECMEDVVEIVDEVAEQLKEK